MNKINSFRGKYYFLSNMYPVPVTFENMTYSCAESAFQAAKCSDPADRKKFIFLNGYEAKKLGRRVNLRKDWESVKLNIMYQCVKSKFANNPDLKSELLNTKNAILIEGNTWNDTFWGVCNGIGENHLGKILMQIRDELQ